MDYESRTSYSVTVTATDAAGESDSIDVTINVTDVDENVAPAFADDSAERSVAENSEAGTAVGDPVTATDANAGDTISYALGGDDAGSFSIDANGQISVGEGTELDYESRTSYSVTVTATDDAGASDSIDVTINVTDVDEVPPIEERFDTNGNGVIDRDEVYGAIQAFLADEATRDDVLTVIGLFLAGDDAMTP